MERVVLGEAEHRVGRLWVRGRRGNLHHGLIGMGELADRRWFIAKAERGTNMAWIAGDERAACSAVERLIARRGGHETWQEIKPEPQVADSL
ncbi:hypothetical protein ACIA5D_50555 [Actinoplanes sp. NPDC051513]|uniref:hypothetical protein n=1 Tax=Actinoplanes sp. NPDC051513 TaxID=3363908 RepID=UPI00378C0A4E